MSVKCVLLSVFVLIATWANVRIYSCRSLLQLMGHLDHFHFGVTVKMPFMNVLLPTHLLVEIGTHFFWVYT